MRRLVSGLIERARRLARRLGERLTDLQGVPVVARAGRAVRAVAGRWMPRFTDYRPLAAALGLSVAGAAVTVTWLAVQAEPTLMRLESLAATRSLTASLALPALSAEAAPAPGSADPIAAAPGLRQLITAQTDDAGSIDDAPPVDDSPAVGDSPPADDGDPDGSATAPVPDAQAPEAPDAPVADATDGVPADSPSAEPDSRLPGSLVDPPLVAAPLDTITEISPFGILPKIGPDGEVPWRVYARPFDTSRDRPRVAIIVMWLGLDTPATRRTIERLPPDITLGFMPYPEATADLMAEARGDGHETLLMLPMEPTNYPQDDPGPQALLARLSPDMNRQRLEWVMGRASGYVGVVSLMGGAFVTDGEAVSPMLQILARRGLIYVDNRPGAPSLAPRLASEVGASRATVDRRIDSVETRDAIDLRLRELEAIARERGAAVGVAHAYPVTLDRLVAWVATLDAKTIDLAPVSALVNLQPDS